VKADDLRNAVYEHLPGMKGGSLSFWGDWFGRPHDNVHRLVGAVSVGEKAVLFFDLGESLILDEPDGWSFAEGALLVRNAKSVRFQWFSYGRLPGNESLQFREYRWRGSDIQLATDFMPDLIHPKIDPTSPAVQLQVLGD
jgi:hypothetical protein